MSNCNKCGRSDYFCNCDQIDKIIDVLHNEMQFYDEEGLRANHEVLLDIERVLVERFGSPATRKEIK